MADYELSVKVGADAREFEDAMGGVERALMGASKQSGVFGDNLLANLASGAITSSLTAVKDLISEMTDSMIEAGKYVAKTGIDFDSSMSKVKAISGATGKEFEQLEAKAQETGRQTKFTAAEAADAMSYLAMAGWKPTEIIKGLTGTVNLAALGEEDLARTSEIMADTMAAFGLETGKASHVTDIMAATVTNTDTDIAQMGETLKYAAVNAGQMGFSIEDTALAIGLMAKQGTKGSMAGTSLRAGFKKLANPTDKARAILDKYNITLSDSEGKMLPLRDIIKQLREKLGGLSATEKSAAAATLFGTTAMTGWQAIISSSSDTVDELTSAIDNSNGAAQKMADTMQDNVGGQITILKSGIDSLAISIWDCFKKPLQGAVQSAQSAVMKIEEGFKSGAGAVNLSQTIENAFEKIKQAFGKVDFQAVGNTIAQVIGAIIEAGGDLMAHVVEWAASADWQAIGDGMVSGIKQFADFIMNLDWGAIGNTIKGFFTGIYTAFTTMDWASIKGFFEALSPVISTLANVVGMLFSYITQNSGVIIDILSVILALGIYTKILAVIGVITALVAIIGGPATLVIAAIGVAIAALVLIIRHWGDICDWLVGVWEGLREKSKIFDSICTTVTQLFTVLRDTIKAIFTAIATEISARIDIIKTVITGAVVLIYDIVTLNFSRLKDDALAILNRLMTDFSTIIKSRIDALKAILQGTAGVIVTLIQGALDRVKITIEAHVERIKSIFQTICSIIESIMSNIVASLQSHAGDIGEAFQSAFSNAVSVIQGIASDAWGWGYDIVSGVASGIWGGIGEIYDAVSSVTDAIWSYLHFSEPDKGPLADFHTYMPDMMNLLTSGIYSGIPSLQKAALTAANTIAGATANIDFTAGSSQRRYTDTGSTTSNTTTNLGGISVNVTGAQGQSTSELADMVAKRILAEMQRAVVV